MAVPKRGQKRPSSASGGVVKKQCTEVVKALAKADLPQPVVDILKVAAPFTLSTYAEERHPHQVKIVDMIQEALKGIQAFRQKEVADCEVLVSSKDAEKGKREAAVLQAGKELMTSKIAVASTEYKVYEQAQVYAKAGAALKETKKDQKSGNKTYSKLEESKTELEGIKARILESKSTKYSAKQCSALEKELKPYVDDESLVESLHLVMAKEPADRSEFDAEIMNKMDAALATATAGLDSKLGEEEPAKKARDDAVVAAQSANDSAKEKLTELEGELEAAKGKVTESEKNVSAAEESLKKYPSDMVQADSDLTAAQDRLAGFMVTVDTFNHLKDRTTPPAPEPEATEPVPAAAES